MAEMRDLAGRLPMWRRMAEVLKGGSMTIVEIAGELDEKVDTVDKAARRGDGKWFIRVPGPDGIYRIGLAARDAA